MKNAVAGIGYAELLPFTYILKTWDQLTFPKAGVSLFTSVSPENDKSTQVTKVAPGNSILSLAFTAPMLLSITFIGYTFRSSCFIQRGWSYAFSKAIAKKS
jgi:hypothetical protein